MRRRAFVILLGGAAVWPVAARAQQTVPVIGFLSGGAEGSSPGSAAAFRQGLSDAGYVEGRNLRIEYRWADGHYDRLAELASELVRREVAAIATAGGDVAALAAKAATATIPIVSTIGGDPVAEGLVGSLNRPGGNLTGVSIFAGTLTAKRLALLHELIPHAAVIAMIGNPSNPHFASDLEEAQAAARTLRLRLRLFRAASEPEIDATFAALAEQRPDAVFIESDPFFNTRQQHIVSLMTRHAFPTIFAHREFAAFGGLASYGSSLPAVYRQVGIYIGRILKGAKPADLPVIQPTTFELVINLKAAQALGVTVPPSLLARADEVIE